MSNQAVGSVYQTIIEEVINSSRVDFEESGVEEAVLEELRLVSTAVICVPTFACPSLSLSLRFHQPVHCASSRSISGLVTASSLCRFPARSRNSAQISAHKSIMLRAILVAP
jgi:hypothetical protein